MSFEKVLKYKISWKSVQWEPSCPMWTNRHDEASGFFFKMLRTRLKRPFKYLLTDSTNKSHITCIIIGGNQWPATPLNTLIVVHTKGRKGRDIEWNTPPKINEFLKEHTSFQYVYPSPRVKYGSSINFPSPACHLYLGQPVFFSLPFACVF